MWARAALIAYLFNTDVQIQDESERLYPREVQTYNRAVLS
jgi:hypothetical protein